MAAFVVMGFGLLLSAAALLVRRFAAPEKTHARWLLYLQNIGAGILVVGALLLLQYTR